MKKLKFLTIENCGTTTNFTLSFVNFLFPLASYLGVASSGRIRPNNSAPVLKLALCLSLHRLFSPLACSVTSPPPKQDKQKAIEH
ncbi:hypothetical protein AAFF_G00210100 [Aldrovandia affinis]|uniref:Uncharacterized protein n=1 Tax=Aldrovandia affinis TaxID=143900 RepID=A0AAD7SW86_9TELE|nr:hypothetical protein AAFF_G00210100 [Aldrovandia affinis]